MRGSCEWLWRTRSLLWMFDCSSFNTCTWFRAREDKMFFANLHKHVQDMHNRAFEQIYQIITPYCVNNRETLQPQTRMTLVEKGRISKIFPLLGCGNERIEILIFLKSIIFHEQWSFLSTSSLSRASVLVLMRSAPSLPPPQASLSGSRVHLPWTWVLKSIPTS